jgi:hypothetical protein
VKSDEPEVMGCYIRRPDDWQSAQWKDPRSLDEARLLVAELLFLLAGGRIVQPWMERPDFTVIDEVVS